MLIDTRGKGDWHLRAENLAPLFHQRHRQHVQRRAGEIHDLVGEKLAFVNDLECVAELDTDSFAQTICSAFQTAHDVHGIFKCDVGLINFGIDCDLVITEPLIQQMFQLLLAQHRRVHFDDDVIIHLGEQEISNAFDFLRRTTVKGG
ncbi:MAG: hypothetical protein ALAOOOJD_04383 [bacterium]|nr:hypothetical protein [bacterium]